MGEVGLGSAGVWGSLDRYKWDEVGSGVQVWFGLVKVGRCG